MRGGKEKIKGSSLKDEEGLKGDLLVRDIWTQGTESIHDIRHVSTEAASYQYKTPEKNLETTDREKKNNSLEA